MPGNHELDYTSTEDGAYRRFYTWQARACVRACVSAAFSKYM